LRVFSGWRMGQFDIAVKFFLDTIQTFVKNNNNLFSQKSKRQRMFHRFQSLFIALFSSFWSDSTPRVSIRNTYAHMQTVEIVMLFNQIKINQLFIVHSE